MRILLFLINVVWQVCRELICCSVVLEGMMSVEHVDLKLFFEVKVGCLLRFSISLSEEENDNYSFC